MTDSRVLVHVDGPVARLTINAPERLGALDPAMADTMTAALERLGADPAVRVIALAGTGRGFCSGAAMASAPDGSPTIEEGVLHAGARLVRAILECPTPVVGLVHGVAAGIGVSLALACDHVVASEAASFVQTFTNIGLLPDGAQTALVAASIGRARALRLALTGERVTAADAAAWGLVAECVPADAFAERCEAVLAMYAARAPLALARTKAAINAATIDLEATLAREVDAQVELFASPDAKEGITAFLAKRTPVFRGEGGA